ncbi:GxxExxY protein [Arenimonas metalli]|uniref:GxxExxY protein n=1 Tax=Arenimonas metalli CF5-1 TaxID=1384056 RepID=A0A091B2Y1_9GAMM|nr:GxxExxY protein [Arenimonas metalli]KFN46041.1 hypothetical protein N787_11550 [Arenimonas metalli CF5-1]
MNADRALLINSDISEAVLGCFFDVYNELGPGFLESVYENAMTLALQEAGYDVSQQVALTVWFRGQAVGDFRADLIVGSSLVVEIKAVSQIHSAHEVQLVNYLKASRIEVGLLLNFGPRPQFKRRVLALTGSDQR